MLAPFVSLGAVMEPGETPWIVWLFVRLAMVVVLIAMIGWSAFGVLDLYRREDVRRTRKVLWLIAFIVLPPVLIVYGAKRASTTNSGSGPMTNQSSTNTAMRRRGVRPAGVDEQSLLRDARA